MEKEKEECKILKEYFQFYFIKLPFFKLPNELILEIITYFPSDYFIFHTFSLINKELYQLLFGKKYNYLSIWKVLTLRKFKNFNEKINQLFINEKLKEMKGNWKKVYFECMRKSFGCVMIFSAVYLCLSSTESICCYVHDENLICYGKSYSCDTHGKSINVKGLFGEFLKYPKKNYDYIVPFSRVFNLIQAMNEKVISIDEFDPKLLVEMYYSNQVKKKYLISGLDLNNQLSFIKTFLSDKEYRYNYKRGGFIVKPVNITVYYDRYCKELQKKYHANQQISFGIPWFQDIKDGYLYENEKIMVENYNLNVAKHLYNILPYGFSCLRTIRGDQLVSDINEYIHYLGWKKKEKDSKSL